MVNSCIFNASPPTLNISAIYWTEEQVRWHNINDLWLSAVQTSFSSKKNLMNWHWFERHLGCVFCVFTQIPSLDMHVCTNFPNTRHVHSCILHYNLYCITLPNISTANIKSILQKVPCFSVCPCVTTLQ